MQENEVTVIESAQAVAVNSAESAVFDVQIATAKKYPRDIKKALGNSIMMATMDHETAATCGYSLPRGGKTISGPSIHLAKIIAQTWGNLRVEAREVETTATQIICQAVCFDLESNYAAKIEVRKSIVTKYGKRFNDDMITMSSRVASSIAFRNSVFAVIPKAIVNKVYNESRNAITGDLSDEAKLIKRRKGAMSYFIDEQGVTEEELFKYLGVGAEAGIKQDQIVNLLGLVQAIKDGDTTIHLAFNRADKEPETGAEKKEKLKAKKKEKIKMP